jgi:hypothetical protein
MTDGKTRSSRCALVTRNDCIPVTVITNLFPSHFLHTVKYRDGKTAINGHKRSGQSNTGEVYPSQHEKGKRVTLTSSLTLLDSFL